MAETASVSDTGGLVSGERSVPPVTLRSVQQYRSQDEYVVVMKEDLAEWMNELYETTMTADDLFDKLETGILLCRYACTVDDVIQSRDKPVVYRKRDVVPGSFQARVNVAAFLAWCRRSPLLLPDDLLFETGDLICPRTAERNERQVALSLLEVGRRSAALKVGLPAPQLVRLEAEIDAEIRADDDNVQLTASDCRKDCLDEEESLSSSSPGDCSAPRRTIRAPRVIVKNDADEPSIPTDSTNSERRGSAWQRRRYRPIIPVDMMSLDEMVRQILGRCTCPNQYPMICVSEGKYRVGDNLTLIFVRVLRQHVMVRIGGGWNTLDNYLARCDPCRCQKSSTTSASTSTTSTCSQSPTSDSEAVSERQRQAIAGEPLDVSCSNLPSSSALDVTMTTVTASGHLQQQQQPIVRRVSDLSPRSKALAVSSRATTTTDENGLTSQTNDVMRDSAAANNDFDVTCPDSVQSTSDRVILSSSSSSPSLSAAAAGTPMPASCSCTRLMSGDEARRSLIARRRTFSCRPSRIPVPVRLAAQCRSHGASLLRTGLIDPYNRCDSGLDLNLSPPNFD